MIKNQVMRLTEQEKLLIEFLRSTGNIEMSILCHSHEVVFEYFRDRIVFLKEIDSSSTREENALNYMMKFNELIREVTFK